MQIMNKNIMMLQFQIFDLLINLLFNLQEAHEREKTGN